MKTVLRSHLNEGDYRRATVYSVLLHVGILLAFTVGLGLLPAARPIEIGLGPGGGQGDFVSVGLSADTGGGAGMYKPPVTNRAESAPPPQPKKSEPVTEETQVPPEVFTQTKPKPKPKEPEPPRRPPPKKPEPPKERAGLIPRESDPGKGTPGGAAGSGGGFGPGRGVQVGSGSGETGTIDSWYIRQVEQRVGKNWLQTSLGSLQRVEAVATFLVQPDGQIAEIQLERRSGVSSVDLAVMRAIQASNPLPPLPYELRSRSVRFKAVFEYPPR
ncbi:MAG: energy transducer TonB [Acidobacteriota bacterium]